MGQRQKTLAARLGLSRTSISNIERGTQRIFIDQLYEAADALKVDVSKFLPTLEEVSVRLEVRVSGQNVSADVVASAGEVARSVRAEVEQRHADQQSEAK